jgi:hypothetical protein
MSHQKNVADEAQVKNAASRADRVRERELKDLRQVLSTIEGRRFVWGLLGAAGVNRSIWEPSAKIHYNAGRQDVGIELQRSVVEASEEAFLQMMKESKQGAYTDV